MKLKQGDRATFGARSSRTINGKVFAVINGHYLVSGDCGVVCQSYSDGMFRFSDQDIVDSCEPEPGPTLTLKEAENTALGTFTL